MSRSLCAIWKKGKVSMNARLLRRFLHDREGNLSVMMTLTLIPVAALVGIIVNSARLRGGKRRSILLPTQPRWRLSLLPC